jgi:5-methylcytosine-specific restriction endonuclease McrA
MRKTIEEERKAKHNLASKKWRAKNQERVKLTRSAWNAAHPEKINKATKKWRERHPQKVVEYTASRYAENRDKQIADAMAWQKKHPERVRKTAAARRIAFPEIHRRNNHNRAAKVAGNGGKLSPGVATKLMAFQKNRCAICRASLKKHRYHIDHIIPLAKGGKNADGNIQLTCPKCNLQKRDKDPIEFMRSRGYLL